MGGLRSLAAERGGGGEGAGRRLGAGEGLGSATSARGDPGGRG